MTVETVITILPDGEKITYQKDMEKNEIIYNPQKNPWGRFDESITNTAIHMCGLAKYEKCDVVAKFNGAPLRASAGMHPSEISKQYNSYMTQKHEQYLASPEYQEYLKSKEERKAQVKADDERLKDIQLDVSEHDTYFNYIKEKKSKGDYIKGILGFAERWGKLMQVEMEKAKTNVLTKEIADRTENQADAAYGMSGASFCFARNLLITTWKYGDQLGIIHGFAKEEIAELRQKTSNEIFIKPKEKETAKKGNPKLYESVRGARRDR